MRRKDRPRGWGLTEGPRPPRGRGCGVRRPLGVGIRPPGLGPGRGSSYLRGEAPGPGGGGGSGCGASAPRRLLHHNIPRPGARGPRGRAPSGGGARGAGGRGARRGAILGRERARAREPVAGDTCRSLPEGPALRDPWAPVRPTAQLPWPAASPGPGSQSSAPASADPCPARHRPPRRGPGLTQRAPQGPGPTPPRAPHRRGCSGSGCGGGRAEAAWGGAPRSQPAPVLRQQSLTSWWRGDEDTALVIIIIDRID